MTALTRTALLAAVAALMTVGGCSKKEPAAPAEPAATSAPAPAPTPPAATAEPAPAPTPPPAAEAPAAAPPAPPADAVRATPESAAAPATAPATSSTPAPASAPATETVATTAPAKPIDGGAIAQGICVACHGSGMNGAPKLGNKIAWTPRIAQGRETVYTHALKGLRGMPPRGGNPALSDDEVKAAVDYMVKLAGGWKE